MIAVDTNVLIYFVEGSDEFGVAARSVLEQVANKGGVVSSLVFAEFTAGQQDASSASNLNALLDGLIATGTLSVIPVDRAVAERAGRLRKLHHGVSLADALHLACAQTAQATIFYTNDLKLVKLGKVGKLVIKPL